MLERDVNNVPSPLGRFAPQLLQTKFAREIWTPYEHDELHPHALLTGTAVRDRAPVDAGGVLQVIDDAREEAIRRRLGSSDGVGYPA